MSKQETAEVSIIEKLDANNLPEFNGWIEKQKTLVKDNPFILITDSKTYELACKSRTNLLKGRTELEKQETAIASKVMSFRKQVGFKTKELIEITLPNEEAQQFEVKRWEGIKEAEKAEKERLENLRIETIKNRVFDFESDCMSIIQKSTIENVNDSKSLLDTLFNTEYDYEEFDILFTLAKNRCQSQWDLKCDDIQEKENQRKKNEQLKKEVFESRKKLLAKVDVIEVPNENKLSELDFIFTTKDNKYQKSAETIYELTSDDFDKYILELETEKQNLEQAKRDAEIKQQKDEQFEVRKNRLAEIGIFQEGNWFKNEHSETMANLSLVYEYSISSFEGYIKEAKDAMAIGADLRKEEEEKKEDDLRLSLEDAENLKKQLKAKEKANSETVKRLKADKEIISVGLETYFADLKFNSDNAETISFLEGANIKIQSLKNELLTELKNL